MEKGEKFRGEWNLRRGEFRGELDSRRGQEDSFSLPFSLFHIQ